MQTYSYFAHYKGQIWSGANHQNMDQYILVSNMDLVNIYFYLLSLSQSWGFDKKSKSQSFMGKKPKIYQI